MAKYAYFDPANGQVLQWLDTDALAYNLPAPDHLLELSDEQWVLYVDRPCWVVSGALTDQPRPTLAHDWVDGRWQLDEALAAALVAEDAARRAAAERDWRDGELGRLFELRDRHRDEVDLGIDTTLPQGQFGELLGYIQRLRDWPQASAFPDHQARPAPPDWLGAMLAN